MQSVEVHPNLVPARPLLSAITKDAASKVIVDDLDGIQFPSSRQNQSKGVADSIRGNLRQHQQGYKNTGKQRGVLQPMDAAASSIPSVQLSAIANAPDPMNLNWGDSAPVGSSRPLPPAKMSAPSAGDKLGASATTGTGTLGGLWEDQVAPPKDLLKRRLSAVKNAPIGGGGGGGNGGYKGSYYNNNAGGSFKGSSGFSEDMFVGSYPQAIMKTITESEEKEKLSHGGSSSNNGNFQQQQQQLSEKMSSVSLSSPLGISNGFPPLRQAPPGAEGEGVGSAGLSPAMAIQHRGSKLVDSELSEILDYPLVYFFGEKDVKVKIDISKPNRGYDDDRGDYKVQMGDHLAFRFELLENIGKGSFGQVFKSKDHKKGTITAVKIIRNKKRFQQQAKIEIKILNRLKATEGGARANCIQISETFEFRNHTCLVFPLYGLNLYEYLKAKGFRGCSMPFVRQVAIQLLDCLAFLSKQNIIHCDLKPGNILYLTSNDIFRLFI